VDVAGGGELKGPDLTRGVAAADIPEGGWLLGHAAGDAVLLARLGGVVHAIGATCTHYGGPLAEGLYADGRFFCPWHHACFDARTGEALRAPALGDLPTWEVEERGGHVFVGLKRPARGPRDAGRALGRVPAERPAAIVVVGAGAAGSAAAEMVRRRGYDGPVVVLDPDADAPYDKPNLSKDYLAGSAPEEWIPLRPAAFWADNGIELRRTAVRAIDPALRVLALEDGGTLGYGALLLAPGAEPVRLDVPVADRARVFYLRTHADSRAIIAAAGGARRAVVIGASFIGLEAAAALRERGIEVAVLAPERTPLARVFGDALGGFIRSLHEEHGVRFHLERTPLRIERDAVVCGSGERLPADFVVVGIGVRPRTALAESAGLDVDDGILVDATLRTSQPGIWAAGDAARWPDPRTGERIRVEHWVVAQRLGQLAAANMLGAGEPVRLAPFFWSRHYDASIAYVGHARRWDALRIDGDLAAGDFAVEFLDAGERRALATLSRDRQSLEAELAMERQASQP
jgi:NADPH-dependent 2,4-dienoyl-CoA reductase/sulfur reductase-like enzyme/nitrite reductase/ring-hydroxylating ferredoxin subunit